MTAPGTPGGRIVPGTGEPVAPITIEGGLAGAQARLTADRVTVDVATRDRLAAACAVIADDRAELVDTSRDWWPLAMIWATTGGTGAVADVVCRPGSVDEVSAVLAIANEAHIPVTAVAGRSGVNGGSVPVHGGIALDLLDLAGIRDIDIDSQVLDVLPGTFGDHLEHDLRTRHGVTLGHWPQSIALSTVGGWLACRSAGQYSNRYGKIEDMVVGLDVALADGRVIHTGGAPRAAVGPDLNQLFVGSEGTLGVILGARLRLHDAPTASDQASYGFSSFSEALTACRRTVQRGAPPAVLRLYDAIEGDRNFQTGDHHLLLALDEGDPAIVAATMGILADECAAAEPLDPALVDQWMGHRNDVEALESLISNDFVVDTMEIAGPWSRLDEIYEHTCAAIAAVDGTMAVSAHQSHAYSDGACLYFTFAGRPEVDDRGAYYRQVWDAGTHAVLDHGGALSHHHGIGLNRSRFVASALGDAFDTLVDVKNALDPNGILNPGKLGLPSPFGSVDWA